jgi:ribosomal protein S13
MLYLLETNLPDQKSIFFALLEVHGIGREMAFSLCKKLGFSINLKVKKSESRTNDRNVCNLLSL